MMDQRSRIEIDTALMQRGWVVRALDGKNGNRLSYLKEIPVVGNVAILVNRFPSEPHLPVKTEVVVSLSGREAETRNFGDDADAFFFVEEKCKELEAASTHKAGAKK